jgi:hypothetical protein
VGPPTVAAFDGDGEPEIGVAGNNVYLVLETDGSVKWENPVQDVSSGFTGSSVFDFEGDGKAEVVYADENDVWVFDGETGAVKLKESEHSSATCSEYPSVADVDADGHAEIVYTSSAYSGQQNGLRVIGDADDSWMAGREVWNQHAYAITNVEDDGGIPTFPQPNWPAYNNFRSGDVTAVTGNGEADAVILANACDLECAEDRLFVVVRVGNEGTSDLPEGIPVAVYTEEDGEDVLLDTWTTEDEVDPGETTEPHVFALDADDVGDELWVVVDDDGTGRGQVQECDERNNDVEIEASCSAR